MKEKIAISLDKGLLRAVDSKVDGSVLRSRSQAIEFYLKKGLQEFGIDTAVILMKGEHQKVGLKNYKGKSLVGQQLDFFFNNNIKNIILVTDPGNFSADYLNVFKDDRFNVKIVQQKASGNADALQHAKELLKNDFIVISGDTFNDFDLAKMVKKHMDIGKLGTIGLMTRGEISKYGIAVLDGDFIVDFSEKPKNSVSNIANAGIYLFKPEVFELFDGVVSLEKDLFPKLARIKQLVGFFTYGDYMHYG